MKTKKIQHLIFLSALVAIFLAVISIFAVNRIMAREIDVIDSRSISNSNNPVQEKASELRAQEKREVEKELKPEVKIEIKEIKREIIEKVEQKKEEVVKNAEEKKEEVIKKVEEQKKEVINKVEEKKEEVIKKVEEEKKEVKNNVSQIKSEVEGAEKVEYKLVKKGSIEPVIYLGEGEKEAKEKEKSDDEKDSAQTTENKKDWSLEYDFSNIPKGEYDLYADVKNQYGTYSSNKTSLKIEEGNGETIEKKVLVGQEGITIKVSEIKNNNAGEKIKELGELKKTIESDPNLSEEEKEIKLKEIDNNKKQVISEFNFRNQIEEIYRKVEDENSSEEDKKALEEVKQILAVDSDGDGLPDHEELRIGTDPFSADTDQDGYLDGDEVANGYDPLTPSTREGIDKIVFEEPKKSGKENLLYQVEEVDFSKEGDEKEGVVFKGRALPNSFVTLYIYSSPVVVTVKTDEDGNWSYVLSKELEDGNHEVYAAVTDNTGKVTSKSKPLAFVKTAQAINPVDSIQDGLAANLSPVEAEKSKLLVFVVLISIFSLISAVTSIILLVKHNREKLDN